MSTVCSLYQGDIQGVAHGAGDNDRRNVYPTNIGTDAVTNWVFIQDTFCIHVYNHEFIAL